MKVPLSWLREYVDVTLPLPQLIERLALAGLEAGGVLFDGHSEEKVLKELKPSKIRGVSSDAMVCSAYELGISDEHEGIILLEDDAPVGTPLADYMGDIVAEIDVLPNMARCLAMIGVAREVAALTGQTVRLPPHAVQAAGEPIEGQ